MAPAVMRGTVSSAFLGDPFLSSYQRRENLRRPVDANTIFARV
jgi:hypothetical protein